MKKAAREGCFLDSGAGNRSRTYDLRITNALLYQLSYAGKTICCCFWTKPESASKTSFFFQFAAFLGPDLERPKLYQSFFAMGSNTLKKFRKKGDLHALLF